MSEHPCDRAYNKISGWRRQAPERNGKFLPRNAIIDDKIIYDKSSVDAITTCRCQRCAKHRRLLTPQSEQRRDPRQYSDRIIDEYRSLFALLIWQKKPALVLPFVEHGVSDKDVLVHLSAGALGEDFYVLQNFRENLLAAGETDLLTELIDGIESNWTDFLRPYIGERPFTKISPRCRLPFYDQHQIGKGGSSNVLAFKIYDGYNEIQDTAGIKTFARKRSFEPRHVEQELTDLMNALKHEHIARLLTTYEHHDTETNSLSYNMIFPRATTNLDEYLRDPASGSEQISFANIFNAHIWREMAGITEALHSMHRRERQWAVHLDLKPENILVDDKLRTGKPRLMITDFGVSVLRDPQRQGSNIRNGGGDPAYAPPERDGDRKYDIWSMGTILLEVLTFTLEGHPGMRRLDAARGRENEYDYPFWEDREGGPHLRRSIDHHMNALASFANNSHVASPRGIRFVGRMLDLIQHMFIINKTRRPRAGLVYLCLLDLINDIKRSLDPEVNGVDQGRDTLMEVTAPDPEILPPPVALQLAAPSSRFAEPGEGWEEVGGEVTRLLSGLLARFCRPDQMQNEDEPLHLLQVFQQSEIARPDIRLRVVFAHEPSPRDIRARRKALSLVPAYALRHDHVYVRYLAGVRLVRHGDRESFLDFDFDGELQDLRMLQGVLMRQNICHTCQVEHALLERPRASRPIVQLRRLVRKQDELPLLDRTTEMTVQLWREPRSGECSIVIYVDAKKSQKESGKRLETETVIWIVRFQESLAFKREPTTDDKLAESYLLKGAVPVYCSAFRPRGNQTQPALAIDEEIFDAQCRDNQVALAAIKLRFARSEDRTAFIVTYKAMVHQWEKDFNIRRSEDHATYK